MLAERVIEWTQQWKEEGLREGRREGLQQGLQQALTAERALLVRLARTRFGEACAQALAPIIETYTDTEALADIGEWIVIADSSEALLARVQQR